MLLALILAAAPQVQILTQLDDAPARPGWAHAKAGQAIVLHAQVTFGHPAGYRWFKLEPTVASVDNTQPTFHFAPIAYQETPLKACEDHPACPVDVKGTVLPVVPALENLGHMAFQVRVTLDDGRVIATPGLESRDQGGLSPTVHVVAVRRDDSYLGFLTELVGAPFVFGSAGPDGHNQTDHLQGADCADFAVYGRRRMGLPARYTSTYAIDQQAPLVITATGVREGKAVTATGKPISFGESGVHPGDLLHFPASRHVVVLYHDREPKGVLDPDDLIFHTCWGPPTIEAIKDAACASLPWRVLRWPTAQSGVGSQTSKVVPPGPVR